MVCRQKSEGRLEVSQDVHQWSKEKIQRKYSVNPFFSRAQKLLKLLKDGLKNPFSRVLPDH
ncbi:MAG: hypothetical protein EBT78_18690 [Betaproteobacteria bacterium]|nr:hypothetical protein [Betaproteobacteria bacterium]